MTRFRGALALCILTIAGLPALAGDPLDAPDSGVLVLRNGQVLSGKIERVGDRLVVSMGNGAKVYLPAAEVDLQCQSLAEAYQKKREYLRPDNAREHLDLADWCLKQKLHRQAAEQLSAALSADPEEPRIAVVERRLRESLEVAHAATSVPAKTTPAVRADDLEETMRGISAAAIERFTSAVQPVLLNRCATSSCHGIASKSTFKLLRPSAGDTITRRFTQRNLHAVLQTIDQAAPEASPFLTAPRGAHGSAATAVFGPREERQYEQLVQWVKLVVESQHARQALATKPPHPNLLQTAATRSPRTHLKPPMGESSPSLKSQTKPAPNTASPTPPPSRDPFDPEVFNQKYFKEAK